MTAMLQTTRMAKKVEEDNEDEDDDGDGDGDDDDDDDDVFCRSLEGTLHRSFWK